MPKGLTEQQVEHYWREGYVVVRGLFEPADVAPWLARTRALSSGEQPPSKGMRLVRDVMVAKGAFEAPTPEHSICKINFFQNDSVLWQYASDDRLLDSIEPVLGRDFQFVNSMCITKPPGVDGRHPLHQDLLYFGFRPGDAMVGTWTALERATRANGCLSVLPRSHTLGLSEHEMPDWDYVNAAFFGVKGVDANAERVHLEMDAGDTLLFHSQLIHGSGTNRTEGFRRAISTHYARTGCKDLWEADDRYKQRPWIPVRGAGTDTA